MAFPRFIRTAALSLILALSLPAFAQTLTPKGYPHLFVLGGDGKLLASQDTGELEAGKDYDKAKMLAFLMQYGRAR